MGENETIAVHETIPVKTKPLKSGATVKLDNKLVKNGSSLLVSDSSQEIELKHVETDHQPGDKYRFTYKVNFGRFL